MNDRIFTYEEAVLEIKQIQDCLRRYREKDPSIPEDFSYRDALMRLSYLRNRQHQLKKKREDA